MRPGARFCHLAADRIDRPGVGESRLTPEQAAGRRDDVLALHPPLLRMMESLVGEPMLLHLALTGWVSTQRDWH